MTLPDPLSQPTPAQLYLAQLAERLAEANPDAAAELGRLLTWAASERSKVRGFGIVVRFNAVTERVELLAGGK